MNPVIMLLALVKRFSKASGFAAYNDIHNSAHMHINSVTGVDKLLSVIFNEALVLIINDAL